MTEFHQQCGRGRTCWTASDDKDVAVGFGVHFGLCVDLHHHLSASDRNCQGLGGRTTLPSVNRGEGSCLGILPDHSIAIRCIVSQFPAGVKERDAGVSGRPRGSILAWIRCGAVQQSLALDALFW